MTTSLRIAVLGASLAIAGASIPAVVVAQEASEPRRDPEIRPDIRGDASESAPRAEAEPSAAQRAEGNRHLRRALGLFRRGDYQNALVEFERAYEAQRSYPVLYNIGQTRLVLRDYDGALRAFAQYLEEGGAAIAMERRAEVELSIAIMEARTAQLGVRVTADGAEVTLDDQVLARAPAGAPIAVSVGRHRVTIQVQGAEPSSAPEGTASSPDSRPQALTLALPPAPAWPPRRSIDSEDPYQ